MLVAVLCAGVSAAWGQDPTWSHEFASPEAIQNNVITVNGVTWNITTTAGEGEPTISAGNMSKAYGLKFGSSKTVYFGSVTFTTDYFNGYNVKSVSVNILNNGSKQGTFTAQQGSTTIGSTSQTFGQTWTDLTVNTTPGTGGELSFTYSVEQAFYIHSITVVYEENTSGKTTATLTFEDLPEGEVLVGHEFDIKVSTNSDAEIKYQNLTAVSSVKSFDQETGVATIRNLSEGTGRIKFYVEETDDYTAAERTLTFTSRKDNTSIVFDDSQITNTDISKGMEAGKLIAKMIRESDGQLWVSSQSNYSSFTFASLDENVATIAEDGTITLKGAGTVSLTAKYNGSDFFAESPVATYELTVTNSDAPAPITLWSEDFGSYVAGDVPSGGTYRYVCTNGGGTTKVYEQNTAGGTSPELLVAKTNGTFTAEVPLNRASGQLTLTYKTNAKALSVSTTTEGVEGGGSFSTSGEHTVTFTGVTPDKTSITIVFTATTSDNVRLDDIELVGSAEVNAVEAPTFSINGGTYYTPQTVELSCATEGAAIKYSFDETTWNDYTEALTIDETKTIYAKAVKDGKESTVSSITVTIAEKNNVVFNIENKTLAVGESYRLTIGTGKDVQSDGRITLTSDNTVATIDNITITAAAVGTATITISVAEGDTYKAGTTTFTVTVPAPEGQSTAPTSAATIFEEHFNAAEGMGANVMPAEEEASWSGTIAQAAFASDNDGWENTKDNSGYKCAKFGTGSAKGSATTPGIAFDASKTYTLTFKAGAWSGDKTEGALVLSCSDNNATLSQTTFDLNDGAWGEYSVTISGASNDSKITFSAVQASKNRFFLDEVVITDPNAAAPAITVTLNGSGYATYCNQYPLDFTNNEDVTAWALTGIEKDGDGTYKMNYTQITGDVKGGVGMLLKGTAGTVSLTSVNSDNVPSGNKFVGTLAPTYVKAGAVYGLSGSTFKKSASNGTVKANKAYIPADAMPTDAKSFIFVFEDETTGIRTMETHSAEEVKAIYNLAGQRLQNMQRGINIVGGKKILVK